MLKLDTIGKKKKGESAVGDETGGRKSGRCQPCLCALIGKSQSLPVLSARVDWLIVITVNLIRAF